MAMTMQCHACGSKVIDNGMPRAVSKAYDQRPSFFRLLNVLLVVSDCILLAIQPLLVYMSKVDGKFLFSPVSVNFLTEVTKVTFAIIMLIFQHRRQKPGEKSLISPNAILKAARSNYLLAIPAFLYAINNYLKFIMQLYFNPSTVKMLGNLKVLVIAMLMKTILRRQFTVMQWEALGLLLIGITVNQLRATPLGASLDLEQAHVAYVLTLIFVSVPSLASVYNEYALKSRFETSIYLQNLFLYGYGAIFNFLAILIVTVIKGGDGFNLFKGHSKATILLIINNAAQGILSSFFFKYADTILKKYSSTVATIFTGLASAALFGHTLTINFVLGVSIVIISMHQFFSSSKLKDANRIDYKPLDNQMNSGTKDSPLLSIVNGIGDEVSYKIGSRTEREPLLPV